ncbi:hypothetical protein Clacol_003211 [Clathrus columnatus]|uniref:Fungal-type protein kinase domain-containing protein n=1 Tax=Clathrus columnatus TaxID=1419009 RepID=A0AAV5A7N5_9AGAM|nr:hypothetical protein Clacol_003211 [Clathrus columnatus]
MSPMFSWKANLGELAQFIYLLHQIHEGHGGRDNSLLLKDVEWDNTRATPIWNVSLNGQTISVRPIPGGKGIGRRLWLGITHDMHDPQTNDTQPTFIIKDIWRHERRLHTENIILNKIHKKGFVPGVVYPISAGPIDVPTVSGSEGLRRKERIITASTGLPLSACESVLEFLKTIFDLVETHEQVLRRGVLHQDLNWENVLCKPQHFIKNKNEIKHPTINELLGGCGGNPLCLLANFDNARVIKKKYDFTERESSLLLQTSMFVALELSYGRKAYDMLRHSGISPNNSQWIGLEGDILTAYRRVYGYARYDYYNQQMLNSAVSAKTIPFEDNTRISHQPHHDIESVYWIILWFLMEAQPTKASLEHLAAGLRGILEANASPGVPKSFWFIERHGPLLLHALVQVSGNPILAFPRSLQKAIVESHISYGKR